MAAPDWLIDGTFGAALLLALKTLRQWYRNRPVRPVSHEHDETDAATRSFAAQMGGWEKMYHEANARANRAEESERKLIGRVGQLEGDVRVLNERLEQMELALAELRPQICNQHDCQERLVKPPE